MASTVGLALGAMSRRPLNLVPYAMVGRSRGLESVWVGRWEGGSLGSATSDPKSP